MRIGSRTDSVNTPIQVVAEKYGSQSYAILNWDLVTFLNISAWKEEANYYMLNVYNHKDVLYETKFIILNYVCHWKKVLFKLHDHIDTSLSN